MRTKFALSSLVALCATVAVAQPLPEAPPESVGMSSERLSLIEDAFLQEIELARMPGAVVAIARRGKLVYYEAIGFQDREAGIPMSTDSIFPIASMTKVVVAAGALILHEEGRLLLNEPIGNYLPELANRRVAVESDPQRIEPARRQPTIEDLMRHTSGFTYGGQGDSALHDLYPNGSTVSAESYTGQEFLDVLANLPLHHQPGTTWDYGLGLDVVGLAIERLTDQSLGEYLEERIFEPLGMVDTAFFVPSNETYRVAKALPIDPLTGEPQSVPDKSQRVSFDCGGGCLVSTASDFLAFAQMLLDKGQLNGVRILAPRTVQNMTSDHADPEIDLTRLHYYPSIHTDGYGFGLSVAVRRERGQGGITSSPGEYHWTGAYGTAFWIDPEEELVIVLMAQTPGDIRRYNRQLLPALVYAAIVE